jgi:hypothetical protein
MAHCTTLDELTVLATVRHSALPYLGEKRVHACATKAAAALYLTAPALRTNTEYLARAVLINQREELLELFPLGR